MSKHLSVLSYTLAVIAGVCFAGGIKLNTMMRCNMKNSFVKFVIFAAGAIIGSAVTWKYAKDKYEKIADEEIASVKEMYAKKKKTEESICVIFCCAACLRHFSLSAPGFPFPF